MESKVKALRREEPQAAPFWAWIGCQTKKPIHYPTTWAPELVI